MSTIGYAVMVELINGSEALLLVLQGNTMAIPVVNHW